MKTQAHSIVCFFCLVMCAAPVGSQADKSELTTGLQSCENLILQKQYADAITKLKELLKSNPKHPEVQFLLGKGYFFQKEYDAAVDLLNEAVVAVDTSVRYHLWSGYANLNAANTSNPIKAYRRAKKGSEELERALQLDAGNQDARVALFSFYLHAPGILGGGTEKAERVAQELEQLAPDNMRYRLLKMQILLADDKHDEAEKMLLSNLSLCKTTQDSLALGLGYNQLGYAYLGKNKCDQAIACFKRYVACTPREANAHDSLGEGYAKCGFKAEAVVEYTRALEIDPEFASSKAALAKLGR